MLDRNLFAVFKSEHYEALARPKRRRRLRLHNTPLTGNKLQAASVFPGALEEANMPVFIMWAIPAVVVIGGVGYYLVRAVH